MAVFKAYDIRGTVPDQLNPPLAYQVGFATARFLSGGRLVVGRDARSHSPEIGDALVRGMRDAGAAVLDIGLVTTPMVMPAPARDWRVSWAVSKALTVSSCRPLLCSMKVAAISSMRALGASSPR